VVQELEVLRSFSAIASNSIKDQFRLIFSRVRPISSLIRKPYQLPTYLNASRLHQLAYAVLRSIAVYTYHIACQHIRAYQIQKACSLVLSRAIWRFATTVATRFFRPAHIRFSSQSLTSQRTIDTKVVGDSISAFPKSESTASCRLIGFSKVAASFGRRAALDAQLWFRPQQPSPESSHL
jgi:hypothetical protein